MNRDELVQKILSGQDEQAEPAVEPLAAYHDEAVEALAESLAGADADARWWIARTLAAIHTSQSAALLTKMMGDPDSGVRTCAAMALGELGSLAGAEGAQALAAHLADESAHVAEVCTVALSRVGKPAVPALLRALQEGGPLERIRAAKAFIPIESNDAIPALIHALDDENAVVEHYAEEALARMGVGMVLLKP